MTHLCQNTLHLGYDLPAAPRGYCLLGQIIFNDILRIQNCIQSLGQTPHELKQGLLELLDEEKAALPYHSWSSQETVLRRLKRYLQLASLQHSFSGDTAPLTSLKHYVESLERQIRDIYFTSHEECSTKVCKEKTQRLATTSINIARHYSAWITSFNEDENIVLFLIQKKDEIVQCFSHEFFEEMVYGGFGTPGEIGDMLLQKFNARGFTNLLPSLRNLLASL
ncbi:MAG: hypothetical protein WC222_02580 [Parachlamydiales bacterium]|jgi:hypothetical protein